MEKNKNLKSIHIILSLMVLVLVFNIAGLLITSSKWYNNLEKPPIYEMSTKIDDTKIEKWIKTLELNVEAPTINAIYYGQKHFYVHSTNGLSKTDDFNTFTKIKLPFLLDNLHKIMSSNSGLIIISKKGTPYLLNSLDGWTKFDKPNSQYLLENALGTNNLCIIDNKTQSIEKKKKTSGLSVVSLPQVIFKSISSDGNIFASTYTNISKATENGLPLLLSSDGESWSSETGCYIPVSPEGKVGTFDIKSYQGVSYARIKSNSPIPTLYFYRITKTNDGFSTEQLFNYEYSSLSDLTPEQTCIYNIFTTNSTKNTEPGILITNYSRIKELFLIRQVTDIGAPTTYCGDTLFYYGKFGTILSSKDTLNWDWSGLYKRDTVGRNKMLKPQFKNLLGIYETHGYYWFNNSKLSDKEAGLFLPRPFIYMSVDGFKWSAVNFSEPDIIDFNSNYIEVFVRGKEIYLINKMSQKWWTVTVHKNGTTNSTIKASYLDINTVYNEIGFFPNNR